MKTLDLSKDDLPIERALGVKWCVEMDTFGFKVDVKLKPPTRRGILSVISSVYDPLGLAIPFMFPAKLLLQDLCRVKLEWDDPIPSEHKVRWQQWLADLPKLSQFTVQRCFKPAGFGVKSTTPFLRRIRDGSCLSFLPSSHQCPRRDLLHLTLCEVSCGASENHYDSTPRIICCSHLRQARQSPQERVRDSN